MKMITIEKVEYKNDLILVRATVLKLKIILFLDSDTIYLIV